MDPGAVSSVGRAPRLHRGGHWFEPGTAHPQVGSRLMEKSAFEHGVASGDPETDRVVIWTRVSGGDGDAPVEWTLARDPDLREVVASGEAVAAAERDRTVSVDVGGLEAGSGYHYGFATDGEASPVGRTRTLPEA